MLLLTFVVVICACCSDDGEGATTYIDDDLFIYHDTTLSDGTWIVNGSVNVVYNKLTLDNAQLILDRTDGSVPLLYVSQDAQLETYGSLIQGNGSGMSIEIWGPSIFDNTTVTGFRYSPSASGITHKDGTLLLDHSRIQNGYSLIQSNSSIIVRSCVLSAFYSQGLNMVHQGTLGPRAVVKDTRFVNEWNYNYYGTGFHIQGGGSPFYQGRFTVTDCYFNGLEYGIFLLEIEDTALGTIQGNTVENCTNAIYMDRVDHRVTLSLNTWGATPSGTAVTLSADDLGWPRINGETITGGQIGLYIRNSYGPSTFRDINITGVNYGIYITTGVTQLYDSYVRSNTYDFYSSSGQLYLYDCDHTYKAYVSSSNGVVMEPVIVNFTAVTWQEGSPIVEGYTTLENETGEYLSELENGDPGEVILATWKRSYWANITVDKVRGTYKADGVEFRSEPFAIVGVSKMDLVIIDNSTPEVTVRFPHAGDMFETKTLTLKGNYTERGVGMGAIKVTYDGENWSKAMVFDELTWQMRLEDLPDGLLTFTVAINDRAGNTLQVEVPNITIDTVWPFIAIHRPGKHVRTTPIHLLARTEPLARAFVNHQEVDVMPDGMFTALLTLDGYENEVHVRVVDIVGHENWTIVKVYLDMTPPALIVISPNDGEWTSMGSITVKGTTESQATVVVNGQTCQLEYGMFSAVVPLEYGLNQLIITSTDTAGNFATQYRIVRMDDVSPQLKVQAPKQGMATNQERITVSGTVSDENAVRVLVNNLSADVVGENWVREVFLVEGPNTIEIMALDVAGNSMSLTVTVQCDLTAPVFDVELMLDGISHTPSDSPILCRINKLLLKVDPSEASVLRISGGEEINLGAEPFAKEILLEPGLNGFWLHLSDLVGNRAESVLFAVELDNVPPGLMLLVEDDVIYVDEVTYLLRGETDPGCQVTIKGIPAPVLENGSFAVYVQLDEGPNPLRVISIDEAGNQASETIQVIYEVDAEETTMSSWTTILVAAICGLLAGLLAALVVGRRRKQEPAMATGPEVNEGESAPQVQARTLIPIDNPPPEPIGEQEVPGQLPKDPQRERDEWEML